MSNQTRIVAEDIVSLATPADVERWTRLLDCSAPELRFAIVAIGHSAQAIREFLQCEPA